MSIFNKYSTPVRFGRSFFFLMIAVCSIAYFSQTISYANEAGATEAPIDKGEHTEEISGKDTFIQGIYHKHSGNSDGGGCYTVQKEGTKEITEKCGGQILYNSSTGRSQCRECGMGYTGNQSGNTCWHSMKKEVTFIYYELGCNADEDTLVGKLTAKLSNAGWVRNLVLTASYEILENMSVSEQPYIWNGNAPTDDNSFEVSENGVYTLQLNADENANTDAAVINIDINNVDTTGPVIRTYISEPAVEWAKEGVTVTIMGTEDLQPDGSYGCGLHEMPYSYDGGQSWTAKNSCLYRENGVHSILVRDALGNQSSYDVTVSNVDCYGPEIEVIDYDHTPNRKNVVITVVAKDVQPDGDVGAGLHSTPYSFDGGKTWTDDNTLSINKNQTIFLAVRDRLGNETHREEIIKNFDSVGPKISYKMEPNSWTQSGVTIRLSAQDMNAEGKNGIGLAKEWYSLDNGMTWSDEKTLEVDKNQIITVMARDKYNNYSSQRIRISQIDNEQPWVFINMEPIGSGTDMQVKLTAIAGDKHSGLHEEAYSWDMGSTYGTENTKMITENGIYQIAVRDKALNWNYAQIEVDVFPIIEIPALIREIKEKDIEKTVIKNEEVTRDGNNTEYQVQMEEKIERPETPVTQIVEKKEWKQRDMLLVFLVLLFIAGMIMPVLYFEMCTICMYAENMDGEMKYIGRQRIQYKKEHFEVMVPMEWIERCVTTNFLFCSGGLLPILFRKKDIAFLFPEEICVIRKVKRNIEISLL